MEFFEELIAAVVVLALFVPLCISIGGNSGSQAATLVTRAMALGYASPRDWRRVLRRELLMGFALGLNARRDRLRAWIAHPLRHS